MDGLGWGVGGYVIVLDRGSLEVEGELGWSEVGWEWELLVICKDLRGRGGIGGSLWVVKERSWGWSGEVEGVDLRRGLMWGVGWV